MSRKLNTHLRGAHGQAFTEQIRHLPLDQILCVSLDIGKYFHVVIIHNGLGEIVTPTFEINLFQSGFNQLCGAIDDAKTRTQAQLVLTGMEPTGHYFENLARHLRARDRPVTLLNSFAVKQNRDQQLMRREKSDEIDVAAIGDLLRRGEGTTYRPPSGVYLQLQQLERARLSKVKLQTMLKNQILGHLDRMCPGLIIQGAEATQHCAPLFTTPFWRCQAWQHLVRVCPDPRRLATLSTAELITLFHAQGFRLGRRTAAKIIAYAGQIMPPPAELIAIRSEFLQQDFLLLAQVEQELSQLEDRLCSLLAQTPAALWAQVKGLSSLQAASLAAALGDPANYHYAAQIFRRAGLVSGRNDYGTRQRKGQGQHILKAGDVYLRRALMSAVMTLIIHQPVLRRYFLRLGKRKPLAVARVATARKAIGLLWAMLRDQRSTSLLPKKGLSM